MAYPLFTDPRYSERANHGVSENTFPCAICGRRVVITPKTRWVLTWGCAEAVTEAEADELRKGGHGDDTGYFPVGPECLRRRPELREYTRELKG